MTDTHDRLKIALADRYNTKRELCAGGMATVYHAHDVKHDSKGAVKMLRPELAAVLVTESTRAALVPSALPCGFRSAAAASVPRVLFGHPLDGQVSFTDTGIGFGATPDGLPFYLRPQTESHNIALLGGPTDIAVDPATNESYISDWYGNRRVIVFDAESGGYKRHWGAYGETPDDSELDPYDPGAESLRTYRSKQGCRGLDDAYFGKNEAYKDMMKAYNGPM